MLGRNGYSCRSLLSKATLVGLWRDRRAAAALEFAFVVPILIGLYFMTMETSQAIEANKKTGRIASMVADLITQQQQITESEIDAIMKIGGSVIQPYNRTSPSIYVTGIEITDEDTPKVKVAWSRKMVNGAASDYLTAGTTTTVPEDLKVRGTFLIRGEAKLDYKPVLTWNAEKKTTIGLAAAFDKISMGEKYYLRPRMSQQVKCIDC